ncbi:hypothetical protein BDW02DRAFT_573469 [Decorospora gaudefroyi]|uniref:Uncharacterized protein n=1 Tax=Decorospora gaudefroyi TaxID=184978 RepID=A0A6A5JZM3_9PLEO|nr:hypothetical protein BDW02DRAFT_573469 [Decorospora gaudefroyi]
MPASCDAFAPAQSLKDLVAPLRPPSGSPTHPQAPGKPATAILATPYKCSSAAQPCGEDKANISPTLGVPDDDFTRKLTTPAGFRLEPYNEGWNSEGSSLSRLRQTYSRPSSPRRENPKSNSMMSRLAVPTPKSTPQYEYVAAFQGLKLCRVCDAVPYLLGPRTLADRVQVILEHGLQFSETIYETTKISPEDPHSFSDRDRALLAILSALRTPEWTRRERGNWYPQGLAARYDSLRLYKHAGDGIIKVRYVTLANLLEFAQAWVRTPNPARVSGDHPKAKNLWVDIAAKLREREVDIRKIDLELYHELTMKLEGEELVHKLDEISQWHKDGSLNDRFAAWVHVAEQQASLSRQANTDDKPLDGMYSKRFTHKYPLGRPRSELSDIEKAEHRAMNRAAGQATDMANEGRLGLWERTRKRRNTCLFTSFMILIFGAVVGSILWAMGTHQWDFTAAGATG